MTENSRITRSGKTLKLPIIRHEEGEFDQRKGMGLLSLKGRMPRIPGLEDGVRTKRVQATSDWADRFRLARIANTLSVGSSIN